MIGLPGGSFTRQGFFAIFNGFAGIRAILEIAVSWVEMGGVNPGEWQVISSRWDGVSQPINVWGTDDCTPIVLGLVPCFIEIFEFIYAYPFFLRPANYRAWSFHPM